MPVINSSANFFQLKPLTLTLGPEELSLLFAKVSDTYMARASYLDHRHQLPEYYLSYSGRSSRCRSREQYPYFRSWSA